MAVNDPVCLTWIRASLQASQAPSRDIPHPAGANDPGGFYSTYAFLRQPARLYLKFIGRGIESAVTNAKLVFTFSQDQAVSGTFRFYGAYGLIVPGSGGTNLDAARSLTEVFTDVTALNVIRRPNSVELGFPGINLAAGNEVEVFLSRNDTAPDDAAGAAEVSVASVALLQDT